MIVDLGSTKAAVNLTELGGRIRLTMPDLEVPANLRRLIDWVAAYTLSPPGAVLRMALSTREAFAPAKPVTLYGPGGAPPERMTDARGRVLAAVAQGGAFTARDLAEAAAVAVASALARPRRPRVLTLQNTFTYGIHATRNVKYNIGGASCRNFCIHRVGKTRIWFLNGSVRACR